MNEQPEVLEILKQWVEKAEEDLTSAEFLLTMLEGATYGTICFHAQQCVEKYLKALLVSLSIDFPRIHDLGELLVLIPSEDRPPFLQAEIEGLTIHATVHRYPGDYEPLTRTAAKDAVSLARRARDFVRSRLPRESLSPNQG